MKTLKIILLYLLESYYLIFLFYTGRENYLPEMYWKYWKNDKLDTWKNNYSTGKNNYSTGHLISCII